MSPHEIVAGFVAHTRPPRQDQIDALARKQISAWAAAGAPGSGEFGIGFALIERLPDGQLEFSEDGAPGMCAVALDAFGDAIDIVGWPLRCEWLAAWTGRAAMLGMQHVEGCRFAEALTIFPTPFDWLRGDRQGIVIVDPHRAARELREAGPFLATGGIEHAKRLLDLLTPPPPAIRIPVHEEERRAA